MSSNVVLIGKMSDYQRNFNIINSHIQKGNLNVLGIVIEDSNYVSLDDFPVYSSIEEVKSIDFDYFILLTDSNDYYKEISVENEFKQKIIPIRVFNLPYFNFKNYLKLVENPPSIISRHCWGGLLYHTLGLPFKSPFINLFMSEVDFNKLLTNFTHYMNQELEFVQEGYDPILESNYPIIKIGDITLHFNHYTTFDEAKKIWNERKKRINYDNLFFETTTEYKSVALQFKSFNLKNKICFCMDDIEGEYMINCADLMKNFSHGQLGMFVNGTASGEIPYFDLIDLLLNKNYKSRIKINKKADIQRSYELYKTTQWHELEYTRFFGLDAEVPWQLKDKLESYNFIEKLNIKHPDIYHKIDDIAALKSLDESNNLPESFCLKKYNKSSGRDVFLLNKIEKNLYYDKISSKQGSIDELIQKITQNKSSNTLDQSEYLIEESIDNPMENMQIPLEYKVFLFNGIPKLIMQVNRNNNNYSINLFDGNFIPLKEGRDWYANRDYTKVGTPIISPFTYEILLESIKIANTIKDKYVIIDWIDNGEKLIFTEFNFASKATFTGIFSLSREILLNIENSLKQASFTDYIEKGYRINAQELQKTYNHLLTFKTQEYHNLLERCITGEVEALTSMVSYFEKLSFNENDTAIKKLYQHLEIAWLEVLLLYDSLLTEKLCRQIKAGWGFIFLRTFYFKPRIEMAKNLLFVKSENSDWYKIRWAQFIFDLSGTENEIKQAKKYVQTFSNEGLEYAMVVKEKYNL